MNGWSLEGEPVKYQGENLFRMINGGADIYHEYGFKQVVRGEYFGPKDRTIKLESYEMQTPAAAYGMYTFKAGKGGKALKIGRASLMQEYYLNFWKGNLLVTLVGMDSDKQTMEGLTAQAKAVDKRITRTGARPELAELVLSEPTTLSNARYVRGPLGLMSSYIFDTKNIFQVRQGMVGEIKDCKVLVFKYRDEAESLTTYQKAAAGLKTNNRFSGQDIRENQAAMVDRDDNLILINQLGSYIAVLVGQDRGKVKSTRDSLAEKLGKSRPVSKGSA
ncbi:DUF6599 family protein [Dethiosulfatarculus sandiegensis]|uniref:Uncharacterized protein n=1 Tax=Dethiosulfatarculus sandiegensis TaxID=1429043 RepID=A0A0D2HR89_9BACT|nr:DUF6599 family protein [Dethiosulfatarculus sandiegensis]KIX13008.1 hypothetical protein X474_16335 [Dethiosulfatarculus sandiegensis]